MSTPNLVDRLTAEFDQPSGFLWLLRTGVFDPEGAARLLAHLAEISDDENPIDRRLVQVLWFMPVFLQWQKERFEGADRGAADVETTLNSVVTLLEQKIGVP